MKKIVLFLISILGFFTTSCISTLYGIRYAEFELKGKVTDTLDNPIKNIRVSVKNGDKSIGEVYTDWEGNYFTYNEMYLKRLPMIIVKIEDTDGEENEGKFITQTITFPLNSYDYIKGKERKKERMYVGKVSKEINFKLEKK